MNISCIVFIRRWLFNRHSVHSFGGNNEISTRLDNWSCFRTNYTNNVFVSCYV